MVRMDICPDDGTTASEQERVQELFYHPVGRLQDFPEGFPVYHVELLTILLTNQSENAKQLCSEGKNIWIYDQDRKQLIYMRISREISGD